MWVALCPPAAPRTQLEQGVSQLRQGTVADLELRLSLEYLWFLDIQPRERPSHSGLRNSNQISPGSMTKQAPYGLGDG